MMTNNVPTTGLIGVVCGDIIGLPYEFRGTRTKDFNFPLKLNDFSDDTIDEVLRLAEMSARISHNSDEAARGAQAAACVYMNRKGENKDTVRRYIEETFHYDLSRTVEDIRKDYQFEILCDKCVPESIICWLQSDTYEQTERNAVSLGGDADTMAAIAGGIAAATPSMAVPEAWAQACFRLLPEDYKSTVLQFQ